MVRVKKAEELLKYGWRVTDAALEVGYESQSAFNQAKRMYIQ